MDEPIIIEVDPPRTNKRGPPSHFVDRMKKKEDAKRPGVDPAEPIQSAPTATEKSITMRKVRNPTMEDRFNPYSKEESIEAVSSAFQDYVKMQEKMNNASNWNEKVEALQLLITDIKTNTASYSSIGEALVMYSCVFTKDFKDTNVAICKAGYELATVVTDLCGVGPRTCTYLVDLLLPRIHDKRVTTTISNLFMKMSEGVGPKVIVSGIIQRMAESKVFPQQRAVSQFLLRVLQEFGNRYVDVKEVLNYVLGKEGVLSANVDVKNDSIHIICELYRQLGEMVKERVEQADINANLKKTIHEKLSHVECDASTVAASQMISQTIIEPFDLSSELPTYLNQMNSMEGKSSWSQRQDGVLALTALIQMKKKLVNNKAIMDVLSCLKDRLSEVNVNFRAKVVTCVGEVAKAVGSEIIKNNGIIMNELLKLSIESKSNIITALYITLSNWVDHQNDTALCFASLLPYLHNPLAAPRGRSPLLKWMNKYVSGLNSRNCEVLIQDVIECVLDKDKSVREESLLILRVIIPKVGKNVVEEICGTYKTTDRTILQQSLLPILNSCVDSVDAVDAADENAAARPSHAENGREKSKQLTEERRNALANRPGVRVLSKRKGGETTGDLLKKRALSSIPKPGARKKEDTAGIVEDIPQQSPVMEEIPSQPPVLESPTMPPLYPSYSCLSLLPCLQHSENIFMSQREISNFCSPCISTAENSELQHLEFVLFVLSRLSSLTSSLSSTYGTLSQEYNSQYNQVIEALAQLLYILDPKLAYSPSPAFSSFQQTNPTRFKPSIDCHINILLLAIMQLLYLLFQSMQHGSSPDSALLHHLLNSTAVLLQQATAAAELESSTIARILEVLLYGMANSDGKIIQMDSASYPLNSVLHHIIMIIVYDIPFSRALEGICIYMADNVFLQSMAEEDILCRILRRMISKVSLRFKSETAEQHRQCVERIKSGYLEKLPGLFKKDIEMCINMIEPTPTITPYFSNIIQSATQMLSSTQPMDANLTSTILNNQISAFREKYEANRKEKEFLGDLDDPVPEFHVLDTHPEKESVAASAEQPSYSAEIQEKEDEQDMRLQRIRERLGQLMTRKNE